MCIKHAHQLRVFLQATAKSHRRRLLLRSLHSSVPIPFVALLNGGFRNLTYLSCLPWTRSASHIVVLTPTARPGPEVLKLKHLECNPDVDEHFISFLKFQPTITKLDIVSESISCVPSADVLPALEVLSCSKRDLSLFVNGRPIKKARLFLFLRQIS